MNEKIKKAVSDARMYLEQLTKGGVIGVRNCQCVALIAANLDLIENLTEEKEENDEGGHSDDLCEPD